MYVVFKIPCVGKRLGLDRVEWGAGWGGGGEWGVWWGWGRGGRISRIVRPLMLTSSLKNVSLAITLLSNSIRITSKLLYFKF